MRENESESRKESEKVVVEKGKKCKKFAVRVFKSFYSV